MFKKTLAAAAILGAFAGSAFAADVTLYGIIDTGLNYKHVETTNKADQDTFQMASGQNSGARFGLKGVEDLGNGLKVGFSLENGFTSDDGALGNDGRLFGREALVYVQGAFGELSMGRVGALDSGAGRYNQMAGAAHAMSTGWDAVAKTSLVFAGQGDRMDNTVTYQSPKFAGVSVLAQYSFKKNNVANKTDAAVGTEGESSADRYYALGVTGDFGGLSSALVVSSTNASSTGEGAAKKDGKGDDPLTVSGRVSYDFGVAKAFLAAQYHDGGYTNQKKGYGVTTGVTAPVFGGSFKATVGYGDYDYVDSTTEKDTYTAYMVGAGYEYPLSKRTLVYTAAGYSQTTDEYKAANTPDTKIKTTEVMVGLVHKF